MIYFKFDDSLLRLDQRRGQWLDFVYHLYPLSGRLCTSCSSSPTLFHITILFGQVKQQILGQSCILFAAICVFGNWLLLGLDGAHVLWSPVPQGLRMVGDSIHIAQDIFFLSRSQSGEGVVGGHGRPTHKLASFHGAQDSCGWTRANMDGVIAWVPLTMILSAFLALTHVASWALPVGLFQFVTFNRFWPTFGSFPCLTVIFGFRDWLWFFTSFTSLLLSSRPRVWMASLCILSSHMLPWSDEVLAVRPSWLLGERQLTRVLVWGVTLTLRAQPYIVGRGRPLVCVPLVWAGECSFVWACASLFMLGFLIGSMFILPDSLIGRCVASASLFLALFPRLTFLWPDFIFSFSKVDRGVGSFVFVATQTYPHLLLRESLRSYRRIVLVFYNSYISSIPRVRVGVRFSCYLVASGLQHPFKVLERVAIACMAPLSMLEILKIAKWTSCMMSWNMLVVLHQWLSTFISDQILYLGSKVMWVGVMLRLLVLLWTYLRLT